jgi:hypothetical protein
MLLCYNSQKNSEDSFKVRRLGYTLTWLPRETCTSPSADSGNVTTVKPLNVELNPICHLLALLGAHHILHVSGVRVK